MAFVLIKGFVLLVLIETVLIKGDSGVARICCEEGESWQLGHGRGLQGRVQQLLDDFF